MDHQQKDETAVAYLATAMNTKLARARAKGRSGWDTPECTQQHLSNLLREHVEKGDPVDVANYCAFLAARGEGIAPRQCLAQIEEPAGAAPAAVARWGCEDRSAWFALAMGAAASLEDAANCLRDKDAKKAAMGAAAHVRESCNKLWWSVPALEAPAAPAVPAGFALVPIEPTQQMLDAGRWSGAGSVSIQEEWARKEVWSRMLATVAPPPAAYADDLVALVVNLVQALSAAAPDNDLASHALDYLKRNGLKGSPLQAAEAAPQAPAAPVHSKTYSDGTVATGSGSLPGMSPQQQVLCTLLDTVEAMLGGANGATIQIRAALLAAPAAPSDAQLLSEWDRVSGLTKATERRLACMRAVLQRWGSAAPAAPAEPVYQISQPYHTDPKNTWRDASEAAYDVSVPERRRVLFTGPAAPAAPSGLPSGWVPCILTHDGQHPEEAAYGPQIMMDRLKKWLGRYFELLAQKVLAEPVHAEMLAALQAVALDVVHVGAGENAISDAARAKVEAVLEKIGAQQAIAAQAKEGGAA